MHAVVENDSDRTVFYSFCSESVSKREGKQWKTVFLPVCPAVLVPPEPIAPGGSKEIRLDFIEHPEIPAIGFPFDNPAAQYRLEVMLLLRKGEKFRVIEGAESGSFAVRN
jgi:hypothetical protein